MLLKIAPDLDEARTGCDRATCCCDAGIDGLICTNTTLDRAAWRMIRYPREAGGLSGKPLFERSTAVLRGMRKRLQDRIPLIGVGGILDGSDAAEKLDAGAPLVQIYTGLVYRGPWLVERMRRTKSAASAGTKMAA